MLDSIWLIPALPLAGFLFNLAFGSRLPKAVVGTIACATVGAAFLVAVSLFVRLLGMPADQRAITDVAWTWMTVGTFKVDVAFYLDPLSSLMSLVITGVGFLIHVYSTGYMGHDDGYKRYFLYLDRKSTRLNSSHLGISYAVFCLKKKNKK